VVWGLWRIACLPAFDLDDLFWDRNAIHYGVKASDEGRELALTQILASEAWIIEGVYYRWLSRSFEAADLIIVLTPSVWRRDWRILGRFVKRKLSQSTPKKETLADLWGLLTWNHGYDTDNLQRARLFIAHLSDKVCECKSISDVFSVLNR
jgi:hypothetical protein